MRTRQELFDAREWFVGFTAEERAELRELFVRSRFAEEQHFGFSGVENVLATLSQEAQGSGTIKPVLMELFKRTLRVLATDGTSFLEDLVETLRSAGTRYGGKGAASRGQSALHEVLRRDALWVVESFWENRGNEVYLAENGIIVLNRSTGEAFCLEPNMSRRGGWTTQITPDHVADALLTSFRFGGERGIRAGKVLHGWLSFCIMKARNEAEADFDRAVAVSEDGKRIVCADEVWVGDTESVEDDWVSIYPASSFWGRKIFLDKDNYHPISVFDSKDGFLARVNMAKAYNSPPPQFFVELEGRKVFFTRKCYLRPF